MLSYAERMARLREQAERQSAEDARFRNRLRYHNSFWTPEPRSDIPSTWQAFADQCRLLFTDPRSE